MNDKPISCHVIKTDSWAEMKDGTNRRKKVTKEDNLMIAFGV